MGDRLHKFLAGQGVASRRAVEAMIATGRIRVNGRVALVGQKYIPGDLIEIDGKPFTPEEKQEKILLLYHKPVGVECTMTKKPGVKTLADIDFGVGRFFPVGRLDKDSRGLILMTSDGHLALTLSHPRYGKEKEYIVRVQEVINPRHLGQLRKGTILDGQPAVPKKVERVGQHQIRFILGEGRNREIRRLCGRVGLSVQDIFRVRIGEYRLENIPVGAWKRVALPTK